MRALITNDDGIDSPGLLELVRIALDAGVEVVVAAPAEQSSGSSASILGADERGRVPYERRELDLDVPAYAVSAAPALISLIASHGAFGDAPDLVLSGINRGANVGRAVLHSGTVGAALTAGVNGARGLAVSLDVGLDPDVCHWSAPRKHLLELIPEILRRTPGTVFNLNVPNVDESTELREGPLAHFGIVQTITARNGTDDVRLEVADTPAEQDPGSDAALLLTGFATVTSIATVMEARDSVLS